MDGHGQPRRLRRNQPQQGTADEANGGKEADRCQRCQHRLRPGLFWTIPATNSWRENRGKCSHSRRPFDEWWKKTATPSVSICFTNGGINLAESRQEVDGHVGYLTHGRRGLRVADDPASPTRSQDVVASNGSMFVSAPENASLEKLKPARHFGIDLVR
jgi:hypothetical protein